jgi:hypothetical protein
VVDAAAAAVVVAVVAADDTKSFSEHEVSII